MSASKLHRVALLPIHSMSQEETIRLLSASGLAAEEFADVDDLFSADGSHPFDLIVVDARGGGLQVLQQLGEWVAGGRILTMVESSTAGFDASRQGVYVSYARTPIELHRDIQHFLGETAVTADSLGDHRLADRSPFGVFEIVDEQIIYANDAFASMFGRSPKEIIGLSAKELIGRADLPRLMSRLESPPDHAEGRSTLCELRHRDGTTVFADIRAEWVPDGKKMRLVGMARDITMERRLAHLYEIAVGLGESILSEKNIDTILQRVLDAITGSAGFRRAIVALYDLAEESPFEGRVYKVLGSGLSAAELAEVQATDPMPPEDRVLAFQETYRLGDAYYIPHDQAPWEGYTGLSGTVSIEGKWNKDDFLFIPLRGEAGIIGHISVDDPLDGSAPTADSIEPVAALANFAALAVERMYKIHQLGEQKERLRGLSMLPQRLMRGDDLAEVCSEAARQLRDDMGYDLCSILLRDGPFLEIAGFAAAAELFVDSDLPGVGHRIPLDGEGRCRHAVRSGETVSCADTRDAPNYREKQLGMLSEIAVPIPGRKSPYGVICVESKRPAAFRDQDQEIVAAFAAQLSLVIAELYQRATVGRIYALAQELAVARTSDEMIRSVLDFLDEEFDYQQTAVLLREGEKLVIQSIRGRGKLRVVDGGFETSIGEGISGWVAAERRSAIVDDVEHDPRYIQVYEGIRSEMAVPVLLNREVLGVLNVESIEESYFSSEDRRTLEMVANEFAVALAHHRSEARLREQAIRDPLTRLYNRHYFHERLAEEVARCDRYGHSLTLMMIDIDGFRAVNNRLGHLEGDEVLCQVAAMVEDNVRTADKVIRYGGDELLVVMPETDQEAEAIAERLRREAEKLGETLREKGCPISLSIGTVTRVPGDHRSIEKILEEADRLLYVEKRHHHRELQR